MTSFSCNFSNISDHWPPWRLRQGQCWWRRSLHHSWPWCGDPDPEQRDQRACPQSPPSQYQTPDHQQSWQQEEYVLNISEMLALFCMILRFYATLSSRVHWIWNVNFKTYEYLKCRSNGLSSKTLDCAYQVCTTYFEIVYV